MLIRGNAATCPDIHCGYAVGTLAPQPVLSSTMHIKFDCTIDYYTCNSTETSYLVVVNTTSIPYIPHNLQHVEKFRLHDLKKTNSISFCMWKWDLILFALKYVYSQLSLCIHYFNGNYYISNCLLIPQLHYINNTKSHNNNSYVIHTRTMCVHNRVVNGIKLQTES
jgi:hypothetical protein